MESSTKERLQEALSKRGMKQIDLARETGIGRGAISQYISGKVTPKQDKLYLMAKALHVSPTWLMGVDVPESGAPSGHQPANKRERLQLEKVLAMDGITFNGHVLSEDDRAKVRTALELAFWDAKDKNKRK